VPQTRLTARVKNRKPGADNTTLNTLQYKYSNSNKSNSTRLIDAISDAPTNFRLRFRFAFLLFMTPTKTSHPTHILRYTSFLFHTSTIKYNQDNRARAYDSHLHIYSSCRAMILFRQTRNGDPQAGGSRPYGLYGTPAALSRYNSSRRRAGASVATCAGDASRAEARRDIVRLQPSASRNRTPSASPTLSPTVKALTTTRPREPTG
jgi:hypothetical protein